VGRPGRTSRRQAEHEGDVIASTAGFWAIPCCRREYSADGEPCGPSRVPSGRGHRPGLEPAGSATLGEDLLYVAALHRQEGRPDAVIRLALSVSRWTPRWSAPTAWSCGRPCWACAFADRGLSGGP
jgi:hypothetical protein